MTIEDVREYCLSFKEVTEGFPFDEDTLVFKVMGKMFALLSLEERRLNLKCDPEKAVSLREQYDFVTPGYHMSKIHWNSIDINGRVPEKLLKDWIKESYDLIYNSLPRKIREQL